MNSIPNVERSPLSRRYSVDGITVKVDIFRGSVELWWRLEVTSADDQVTEWTDTFATDGEAWDEFVYVVNTEGITVFD
ncbi:hypothetical protein FHP24_27280 [Aliirhizobium smilacinae]|uniref:Uncharacterized protein n=1 Tax=Aliirhizobium smilacinae TaxID=1395944 RepID=A0A5C4X8W0_9HYPH|nr:hypothetical protein FHP24_27280 [Rhizobium smilacinae]